MAINELIDDSKYYPLELYMDLDTEQFKKLGWEVKYCLDDMLYRMILTML